MQRKKHLFQALFDKIRLSLSLSVTRRWDSEKLTYAAANVKTLLWMSLRRSLF